MIRAWSFRRASLFLGLLATSLAMGCSSKSKDSAEPSAEASDASSLFASDTARPPRRTQDPKEESAPAKPPKSAAKTPSGVKIEFGKPSGSVSKITFTNMSDVKGTVGCLGRGGCKLTLENLPSGTKVKLDTVEVESEGNKRVSLEFDMGEQIAKASVKDALKYDKVVDPLKTLEVVFPDDVKVTAALPGLTTKYFIEHQMEELLNGRPVLFGKESAEPSTTHTILFADALLDSESLIGPATTMAEVDLVAVKEALPTRSGGKKCKGYKATDGKGPTTEADLMLLDWEVKLVERRTAKVLDTKKFEGESKCPYVASGGTATSYPNRRAIQAWLRGKR